MAFKIDWKPVLQVLALKDYHPAYDTNVIMVCVNPQPEFWQERGTLMSEYGKRLVEIQAVTQKAEKGSEAQKAEAEIMSQAFNEWISKTFLPGMDGWFARLWSFDSEQWTVEDLKEFENTDPHLLTWLKTRSMEMIEEHRTSRKKV